MNMRGKSDRGSAWRVMAPPPEGRRANAQDAPLLGDAYARQLRALASLPIGGAANRPIHTPGSVRRLLRGSGDLYRAMEREGIRKALDRIEGMRARTGFATRSQLVLHAPGGIGGFCIAHAGVTVDTSRVGMGYVGVDLGHMLLSFGEQHAQEASAFLQAYLRAGGEPFTLIDLSLGMCVSAIHNALSGRTYDPSLMATWVAPLLDHRMFPSDILRRAYPHVQTGY